MFSKVQTARDMGIGCPQEQINHRMYPKLAEEMPPMQQIAFNFMLKLTRSPWWA